MARGLGNLDANFAIFDRLPDAAREQMAESLNEIGQAAVALQRSAVPRRTGALASTLDIQVSLGVLRVRAGILNVRSNKSGGHGAGIGRASDVFYGIIIEYGRKAGEKVVRRRNPSGTYSTMRARWTALAARPFVHVESGIQAQVQALRDNFWNGALARVGEVA
jgi:hypothetical protein